MIAALKRRREAGAGPFTCQSCDNLQGNGDILRQTVVGLAELSDPDLAGWIDQNATFPNSMVDCIVPATGPTELALALSFGIEDAVPVTHENFRQWVIEDKFCAGRPDWDRVGATFTNDVHAFEAMKLRLLNAGHQIIATPGELFSVETIAGTMAHPLIRDLFHKIETVEIVPHVAAVPGMEPLAYVDLISDRFANSEIHDTTRRVAFDGSSRHPGFLHPIIRDALAADAPMEGLALVEALWARMCAGTREDGSVIEPNDPFWDSLTAQAKLAKGDPAEWLSQEQLYGELGQNPRFVASFSGWLRMIWDHGSEAAIEQYLKT
jgi:mannitol 2-dehydrogenase